MGGVDYKKEIGRRIKELREKRDWSLADLSRHTRDVLSRTRIGNYETGERMPGPGDAVILAQALGTRAAYIMAVDDIQLQITTQEETLVRNWRKLPENERMSYFRQIEQLALAYRDSVVSDRDVERHLPLPVTSKRKAETPKVRAKR